MENNKMRLIARQRFFSQVFRLTVAFLFGSLYAIWGTWELAQEDVIVRVMPAITLIIVLLLIEVVAVLATYIAIGSNDRPKSNEVLDQITRLGKLKADGYISEAEFEQEKKRLWEQ